ncbi:MAG: phosphatidylinositol-specific phospholipase C/glycerophosphodiester phosphodiesterase family protein [Planctomycetota bacterium]
MASSEMKLRLESGISTGVRVLLCGLPLVISACCACSQSGGEEPAVTPAIQPQPQAHAHNDYEHSRPLFDALDQGFCSVEADVFAIDGKLLVAHDFIKLSGDRTLKGLYLDPLFERFQKHGAIYRGGPAFHLLIDFKSDADETYAVLRSELEPYKEMLTRFEGGTIHAGAVTVVISGNRPWGVARKESLRYAGLDGRLGDLKGDPKPASLMPLMSDHWGRNFKWKGEGEFPEDERARLQKIVAQAHENGWRVRFWATPENPRLWRELLDAGVDHINTDDLKGLREFLESSAKASGPND